MSEQTQSGTPEARIVQFGPSRAIGLSCIGAAPEDFSAVWGGEAGFVARRGEVTSPADAGFTVGICRCVPGLTDGRFEYIAARPAAAGTPIPEGMIEATLAGGTYAVFPVAGLADRMRGWGAGQEWFAAHPEWTGYCNEQGCDCATHPGFELYPPDFTPEKELFIYVPIRPSGAR